MTVLDSSLNLLRAAWLPLRRRSGRIERVTPFQITDSIDDDPFVAFAWPRPDFCGAAHEFLIGLLATAAAPENEDEWEDLWFAPPPPEVLRDRFESVAHAFDLDGPGPRFLQDRDPLDGAEEKAVAALLIDAPGAQTLRNNADLFVKRGGAPVLGRAAAAMALFTLNAYAPAGGAGHRTSLRGGGPLTTLAIAGEHLWGRLWPNVETVESIKDRWPLPSAPPDDPDAIFPWLGPTHTSNTRADGRMTTPADTHPLQVYWGMPRRIRLAFEESQGRRCTLTGIEDDTVVAAYRTRNYGVAYSEGFEHPLTPYYAQKAGGARLPVHPRPGGLNYRHWPGMMAPSADGLRQPARAIRHVVAERGRFAMDEKTRFAAFGYDMDNMKARAWIEGEWPLPLLADEETRGYLEAFIRQTVRGAETVSRLLVRSVKSALYDRPADAVGDYGFIAERFFRETEATFHLALADAQTAIRKQGGADSEDPTLEVRLAWAKSMETPTLRLFDECAPDDALESRDMERHVRARFYLHLALGGRGKTGRALFGELGIPAPGPAGAGNRQEAA